jgi:hypothetical protein
MAGHGNGTTRALIETDQAAIAAAHQALDDLQRIAVILCHQRWTVSLAERYQENLQVIDRGLSAVRRWMSHLHDTLPEVGGLPLSLDDAP